MFTKASSTFSSLLNYKKRVENIENVPSPIVFLVHERFLLILNHFMWHHTLSICLARSSSKSLRSQNLAHSVSQGNWKLKNQEFYHCVDDPRESMFSCLLFTVFSWKSQISSLSALPQIWIWHFILWATFSAWSASAYFHRPLNIWYLWILGSEMQSAQRII